MTRIACRTRQLWSEKQVVAAVGTLREFKTDDHNVRALSLNSRLLYR